MIPLQQTKRTLSLLVVGLSGMHLGCDTATRQAGEFGDGTFIYGCAGASDAQCDENEAVPADALRSVARNAKFKLSYRTTLNGEPDHYFFNTSKRLEVVERDQLAPFPFVHQEVKPLVAGLTAIVVYESTPTSGGAWPVDFLHIAAFEPTGVGISQRDPNGTFTGSFGGLSLSVNVAGPLELRAAPADSTGKILAGALDCAWTSSDPAIAEITSDASDNVIQVQPKMAGTATLTVNLGGMTESVSVMVEGT